MCFRLPLILILSFYGFVLKAGDSIVIKISEAENIFLKENLFLLAEQYNIDAKEALIIQAKAYPNPVFGAEINAYDPNENKAFRVNQSGEKIFSIEQLIILGGKRRIEIELAKQNREIAQAEFAELLRSLKKELYNSFFNLNQWCNIIVNANHQLQVLDTIITSFEQQTIKGNLPAKDVVRLKSAYLKINAERAAIFSQMMQEMKIIQLLLRSSKIVVPIIEENIFNKYNSSLKSYDELLQIANENRPDLKIASDEMAYAMMRFNLQKRIPVPDVLLSGSYDQRGGAFNNQFNVGVKILLPLWDNNRGNIKAAESYQKESELYLQQKKLEIETDINAARINMQRSIDEYNKMKILYNSDFDEVFKGMNENFQKRNITILEFVDFFEAYTESVKEFERVKTQLATSAAQINYVTALSIY